MNTFKQNLLENFSPREIELLRYFYLCFLYESSKFIIMFVFFSLFHLQIEFCIEVFVLLSIRSFYGGIHFEHYSSCFAFTLIFFGIGLLLSESAYLNNGSQICILFFCLIVSWTIKPITSKNRPKLSHRQEMRYHFLGMLLLFIYLLLFITLKTFPYKNICFWVIVLQTTQLVVARIFQKGGSRNASSYNESYD